MWGMRVLSPLCRGVWDISRVFVLIQDGGHLPICDHSKWRTQVLTGIFGIRFIVIQIITCPNRAGI